MQRRTAAQRGQPPPSAVVGSPAFVGRERELTALKQALAGPPSVVLVEGEAGIGKSRLVQELLAAPAGSRLPALLVRCPPFRQPHTLGPVADALRQRIYDAAALGTSALAGALRPLFPEWAAGLPPPLEPAEDASAARDRVFAALAELLDRVGLRLMLAEDLHLADDATIEFLLYLAKRQPQQVSLVVTYRQEDVPARSLLSRLTTHPGMASRRVRLALAPLDVTATAELVSSMLAGQAVSAQFAKFVHDHAEGVPLAVEESVRMMCERDDLVFRGGEWVRRRLTDIDVPPTIRDSVLERTGRLSASAQALLRAAAIIAEPASPDTLATVSGLSPGRARAGLATAAASGLLAEDGRGLVSFRHALAARAVHDTIPGSDRQLLHLKAAQVLEAVSPRPVADLVRHFREAGEIAKWRRYGEESAELAISSGDEATASVLLCDLIGQAGLTGRAATRLLDKMAFAAMPNPARYVENLVSALRGAISAGTVTAGDEGLVRFQIGRILQMMDNHDGARAEVQRAVPLLADYPVIAVRAMTMLGSAHDTSSPARVYTRWLRKAAAVTSALEPADRQRVLGDRVTALLLLGEEEGWAEAARLPTDGAAGTQRRNVAMTHLNAGDLAIMWGRYDQARRLLGFALGVAEAHQYSRYREVILMDLAHLDWATGNWDGLADRVRPRADGQDGASVRLEAVQVMGLLEAVGRGQRAGRGQTPACAGRAEAPGRDRLRDGTSDGTGMAGAARRPGGRCAAPHRRAGRGGGR
ncbi:MAG TPA: AAA family ATPase [Streptosporangiaceae bacterium]|nr:AAA family ATPase [Streptosporangiaceae bacterium]